MAQFNSYPTKATPIAADTVLIYDSAGAVLKQVPIKNLFENYAGSSLGGSAQTVKSAIDALNSNVLKPFRNGTLIQANTDLDSITAIGNYYSSGSTITNTLVHCPVNGLAFRMIALDIGYGGITYGRQIILTQYETWVRSNKIGSTTPQWTEWKKVPTHSEIDALIGKTDGLASSQHISIGGNGTKTLSIDSLSRVIILSNSIDLSKQGVIFVSTSSNGTISKSTLGNFDNLAMTSSANTLTFTNATGSDCDLLCFVVKGSVS